MYKKVKSKCRVYYELSGETYIGIYAEADFVFIDSCTSDSNRRSFFCDLRGNIICPSQINKLMKHKEPRKTYSSFYPLGLLLVFFNCKNLDQEQLERGVYLNLCEEESKCYLKVLYARGDHCLGSISGEADKELNDCLKLLPDDVKRWRKLVIRKNSISLETD